MVPKWPKTGYPGVQVLRAWLEKVEKDLPLPLVMELGKLPIGERVEWGHLLLVGRMLIPATGPFLFRPPIMQ